MNTVGGGTYKRVVRIISGRRDKQNFASIDIPKSERAKSLDSDCKFLEVRVAVQI
jgi:hypothetical protein